MINGAHSVIFTTDPEGVRAVFRDVLELSSVDAGDGWLIFRLPPGEVAAHPSEAGGNVELYLMCDDIEATVEELRSRGVGISRPVSDEGWGLVTALELPGDAELGLYEPRHPVPSRGEA